MEQKRTYFLKEARYDRSRLEAWEQKMRSGDHLEQVRYLRKLIMAVVDKEARAYPVFERMCESHDFLIDENELAEHPGVDFEGFLQGVYKLA